MFIERSRNVHVVIGVDMLHASNTVYRYLFSLVIFSIIDEANICIRFYFLLILFAC